MAKIPPWFDSPLDAVRAMSADLMIFMSTVTLILLTVAFLALADRGESFNVFWRKARHRLGILPTHIVAIPFFQMFNITVMSFLLACDSPKSGLFLLLPPAVHLLRFSHGMDGRGGVAPAAPRTPGGLTSGG